MIPITPDRFARVVLSASRLSPQHRARQFTVGLARFGGPRVHVDKGQEKHRHDWDFDAYQLRAPRSNDDHGQG